MNGSGLQIFYTSLIIISVFVIGFIFAKDAKKFLSSKHSLTKMRDLIFYSLAYINENMLDSGRFVYVRDLHSKYTVNKTTYNSANHARVLYSMRLCEKEYKLKDISQKRRLSAKYFVENYIKPIGFGRYAVISNPEEESLDSTKARLAASAMALVAFSDLIPENIISPEIFEGLGQFLLFMQLKSGQFYNFYNIDVDSLDYSASNLNFTGEAPLGLLYLYEFNPKLKWLDAAKKGLMFLANKRLERKEVQFDYAAMLATEKLFETPNNGLTQEEKDILINHMIKMAEQVLPRQVFSDSISKTKEKTVSVPKEIQPLKVSCIIEGLIATYNCIDDINLKARIMKSIDVGIKFLRLAQIQNGPLKGGFPTSADWREVGAPREASIVKMDTVQHALAACIKFENMFK